jgi:hypothetical protein
MPSLRSARTAWERVRSGQSSRPNEAWRSLLGGSVKRAQMKTVGFGTTRKYYSLERDAARSKGIERIRKHSGVRLDCLGHGGLLDIGCKNQIDYGAQIREHLHRAFAIK